MFNLMMKTRMKIFIVIIFLIVSIFSYQDVRIYRENKDCTSEFSGGIKNGYFRYFLLLP
jgi:hypothetical protein